MFIFDNNKGNYKFSKLLQQNQNKKNSKKLIRCTISLRHLYSYRILTKSYL